MQTHVNPRSGTPIKGMALVPGAILKPGDRYDSTDGEWGLCPCPGLRLGRTQTFWVRQSDLSEDAIGLLGCLTSYPGDFYGHVTRNSYGWVVIPFRNWDPFTATLNLGTPSVSVPSAVQELIDVGFLSYEESEKVHSVTESGRAWIKQHRT